MAADEGSGITDVKLCVLGPCRAGKTLLCRVLADQPLLHEYEPTAAVRWGCANAQGQARQPPQCCCSAVTERAALAALDRKQLASACQFADNRSARIRVQEVGAAVGPSREAMRAALWDVSGSPKYREHWPTLADVSWPSGGNGQLGGSCAFG
jgi:GTPase SAR1 family protein